MTIYLRKAIVCSIAFFSAFTLQMFAANDDVSSKCGTFSPENMARNRAIAQGEILNDPPVLQTSHSSPSGKFLIHYDTTGINAVVLTDIDHNGIPDWVDSTGIYLDYAYDVEVNQMGFLPPPPDGNYGGTPQYDFYISDLSSRDFYGVTYTRYQISSTPFPRWTTYIEIDNNFSEKDIRQNGSQVYKTFGYDALKVTTAHEFHHAIQVGAYGTPVENSEAAVNEMTSTWMEYRVHPDMVDYVNYLNKFFTQNSANYFGKSEFYYGYSYSIVFEYFHSLYGDAFIKRIWEIIGTGVLPYHAIENAFLERGTTLAQAWCNFTEWMYHTGKRTIPGKFFTKAYMFPELSFKRQGLYSSPSFIASEPIRPFEIQLTQCKLPADITTSSPDTVDFIVTYPNTNDIVNHLDRPGEYTLTIAKEQLPGTIEGTMYKWEITSPNSEMCSNHFLTNGFSSNTSDFVYPNPFHIGSGSDISLYFPVPVDANYNDKITLSIYTLEWQSVLSCEIAANLYN